MWYSPDISSLGARHTYEESEKNNNVIFSSYREREKERRQIDMQIIHIHEQTGKLRYSDIFIPI